LAFPRFKFCLSPEYTSDDYRGERIRIDFLQMICDTPYFVLPSKAAVEKIPVPCGKCPTCKARRVNTWVFRLMQEELVSSSAHFVTLTYDTRFVPISNNGFMTLRKKDFQDYMKRLRKLVPGATLKYYVAGEYGSKNRRPHYHAIIFNVPDSQLFFDAWALGGDPLGSVHVGTVTSDSVAYTMKYIDKANFRTLHGRDDRIPEFSLMSKGLGKSYLSPAVVSYHKADISRMYVSKLSGHKLPMPRYYRNKIFSDAEKQAQLSIIQEVVSSADAVSRRNHDVQYGDRFTYEQAKESGKYSRYRRHYHSSKQNRTL